MTAPALWIILPPDIWEVSIILAFRKALKNWVFPQMLHRERWVRHLMRNRMMEV